jgi:hypothetical protein
MKRGYCISSAGHSTLGNGGAEATRVRDEKDAQRSAKDQYRPSTFPDAPFDPILAHVGGS